MSLLDSLIAGAASIDSSTGETYPQIISQQHDLGQIAVEATALESGLRDLAGVWDAAEYGISAEEVQARIAAANTPEAREKLMQELRARAVSRAGLDTSNGRVNVMVAGAPPWHRLGVHIAEAVSSKHAAELSGLARWNMTKRPATYLNPVTNTVQDIPETYAIVRGDTGKALGVVGSRYQIIQNEDAFAFMDALVSEFGARYETAGSIDGGAKVWMQIHLPKQRFAVNGSDMTEPYAIFENSNDGLGAGRAYPTTERVVCRNTLRLAAKDRGKGIVIRHTGSLKGKLNAARQAMGLAVKEIGDYKQAAQAMATTPANCKEFAHVVLDDVIGLTQADAMKGPALWDAVMKATTVDERIQQEKRFYDLKKERSIALEDILTRYDSPKNGINGMRGTLWAAFNAITESADHGRLGGTQRGQSQVAREERRFESLLTGRSDDAKQIAYAQARALLA